MEVYLVGGAVRDELLGRPVRERDWVVLPSDDPQIILLRPIGGSSREVCGVLRPFSNLIGSTLPFERVSSSNFPLPDADHALDHAAV